MNRIEAQNWLIGEKKVRGVNFKLGLYIYRDDDGVICDQDGKAASNMTNPFSLDCFNAPFEIYEEKQADGFVDKEVLATQGDGFFGANYLGNWFPCRCWHQQKALSALFTWSKAKSMFITHALDTRPLALIYTAFR